MLFDSQTTAIGEIKRTLAIFFAKHPLANSLVGTPINVLLTIGVAWFLIATVPSIVQWAVIDAAFLPAVPETCQSADGACWSFVIAKARQILFGIYPYDEQWRPMTVCVILLALLGYSVLPSSWRPRLFVLWVAGLASVLTLMKGGVAGLAEVPTSEWGGLPVTLILTVFAIGIAFPTSVVLALARRSEMPLIRTLSVISIEFIRAVPLLSLLFVSSIMLPIFLPEALLPDKFVRALVALTLFASAYLAEVIRGGLQAVPTGQFEAADALGLNYWQRNRLIVLPQAIRIVIPALTNTIIVMIKNTSLILVVGLFDIISSGRAALADPAWRSPAIETYFVISVVFFALSFSFARFADFLERRSAV